MNKSSHSNAKLISRFDVVVAAAFFGYSLSHKKQTTNLHTSLQFMRLSQNFMIVCKQHFDSKSLCIWNAMCSFVKDFQSHFPRFRYTEKHYLNCIWYCSKYLQYFSNWRPHIQFETWKTVETYISVGQTNRKRESKRDRTNVQQKTC